MTFIRVALLAAATVSVALPAVAGGFGVDLPRLSFPSPEAPTAPGGIIVMPSTKG